MFWSVRFVWIPESLALDLELFLRSSGQTEMADGLVRGSGARDLRERIRVEMGSTDMQTEADWDLGVERMLALLREDVVGRARELGRNLTVDEVLEILGVGK